MALTPDWTSFSTPSTNGKKASDAATILFLIFEPRGLWGIWFRLRNYFKAWPFSY